MQAMVQAKVFLHQLYQLKNNILWKDISYFRIYPFFLRKWIVFHCFLVGIIIVMDIGPCYNESDIR